LRIDFVSVAKIFFVPPDTVSAPDLSPLNSRALDLAQTHGA
jgi:hypothetical protein